MLVWIVRHGKAEPSAASGRDDDRALAKRGERQADWLGREIAQRKDRPVVIAASPVKRAIETALRITAVLGVPVHTAPELVTGRPTSEALRVIGAHDRDGPLMLVGHNPQLGKLVGVLIEGHGAEAEMKTGQAVLLDIHPASPIGSGREVAVLRLDED